MDPVKPPTMDPIEVRLFATLRNGREKKVLVPRTPQCNTPAQILATLEIAQEEVAILLVNGLDGSFDQQLVDGDYLSVFPPVGGG